MAYRDELEAARARVELLEEELDDARAAAATPERARSGETLPAVPGLRNRLLDVREKLRAAEARIAELEATRPRVGPDPARALAAADARITELEAERQSERERAAALASLPSLLEHNRRSPLAGKGDPAGVLCPMCLLIGDRVEMWRGAGAGLGALDNVDAVAVCPRCRLVHAHVDHGAGR